VQQLDAAGDLFADLSHPLGGTIGLDAMVGGPISGASMTPMLSIGPAIGALTNQLVRGESLSSA
jgi:hypothetical protein